VDGVAGVDAVVGADSAAATDAVAGVDPGTDADPRDVAARVDSGTDADLTDVVVCAAPASLGVTAAAEAVDDRVRPGGVSGWSPDDSLAVAVVELEPVPDADRGDGVGEVEGAVGFEGEPAVAAVTFAFSSGAALDPPRRVDCPPRFETPCPLAAGEPLPLDGSLRCANKPSKNAKRGCDGASCRSLSTSARAALKSSALRADSVCATRSTTSCEYSGACTTGGAAGRGGSLFEPNNLNPSMTTASTTAAPPPTRMARRLVSNSSEGDSKLERAARAMAAASANESVWEAPARRADDCCCGSSGGVRSKGGNRTGGALLDALRDRPCRNGRLASDVSEGDGAALRATDGLPAMRAEGGPAAPLPRGRCPGTERAL
jgi:hypothetical protein